MSPEQVPETMENVENLRAEVKAMAKEFLVSDFIDRIDTMGQTQLELLREFYTKINEKPQEAEVIEINPE